MEMARKQFVQIRFKFQCSLSSLFPPQNSRATVHIKWIREFPEIFPKWNQFQKDSRRKIPAEHFHEEKSAIFNVSTTSLWYFFCFYLFLSCCDIPLLFESVSFEIGKVFFAAPVYRLKVIRLAFVFIPPQHWRKGSREREERLQE